jgi:predicted ATPase with chaperone activity
MSPKTSIAPLLRPASHDCRCGAHRWRPGAAAGEVSLAYHGLLLLDELPEFKRYALEVLRQPLEESLIQIQSPEHPKSL